MKDEMGDKYRHAFLSPIGKDVLFDILQQCHFGSSLDPDNKAQVAEYNVGIFILARCGILGSERGIPVVNALINSLALTK